LKRSGAADAEIERTNTEGGMFKFLRNAFILREIWRLFRRGRRA
jgi:hypothetical protein